MNNTDIEYSSRRVFFDLTDVSITNSIKFTDAEKKDKIPKYRNGYRVLTAKAVTHLGNERDYFRLYAGVPEDKKKVEASDAGRDDCWRMDSFVFEIVEKKERGMSLMERKLDKSEHGKFAYNKDSDHHEIYAYFIVSRAAFDKIEQLTSQAGASFWADFYFEGWHSNKLLGGGDVYVDMNNDYKAKLHEFRIKKVISNQLIEDPIDEEEDAPKTTLTDLDSRMMRMERNTAAIASAAWLTAIAVIGTAAVLIF